MFTLPHFGRLWLAALLAAAALTTGCAATTTTMLETSVHSNDSAFRFQSCDVVARVEVVWARN